MSKWNNESKPTFSNSSKRVEFSGTEIHFSPDSQKISIRLGDDNLIPSYVVNSNSSNSKSQPKRGILKNRLTKPDTYYLGQIKEESKKLYDEKPNSSSVEFDLPKKDMGAKDNRSKSNTEYSISGKTNLTSYKLIIDMFGAEKNKQSQSSSLDHRKVDTTSLTKTIDKNSRPIAKPRKIFPTLCASEFKFTSPLSNGNQHSHDENFKTSNSNIFERNFDLARDERVLNELITAADEIIKNSN
jgi:hypothetical protein